VVQADLLANLPQGQPFLLGLGEGFAPCLIGRIGFALELLLSNADRLTGIPPEAAIKKCRRRVQRRRQYLVAID